MELTVPEQILASVSGAGITALTMTPFDVLKVRSQMTKTPKMINYCNGLMDHIICCREATSKGNKCTRLLRMPLKRPMSCIEAKRCISTQECKFTTKLAFGAEVSKASKPWYTRCPISERNTFRAMAELARSEGVPALWSGLPATIIMALPSTVLYFTAYEQLKVAYRSLSNSSTDPSSKTALLSSFAAGCTARLVSTTCIAPLELIRTKMQVDGSSLLAVTRQLSSSWQTQGIRALFLGYPATILRDVPFSGIYFCAYETGKIVLADKNILVDSPNQRNGLAASIAAAIAGLLTLPFDVIKTRQQMMLGTSLSRVTIFDTYSRTVTTEGYRTLFAGLSPRMIKVVPACAIMMTSYEASKRYFLSSRN